MEVNMKAICAGTKTKEQFVNETLEKYHQMYARTVSRLDVLKAVSWMATLLSKWCMANIHSRSGDMSWPSRIKALNEVFESKRCAVKRLDLDSTLLAVS